MKKTKDNSETAKATFLYQPLTAWFVLAISSAVTIYLFVLSYQYINDSSEARFNFRTQEITSAIESRMYVYESVLRSGVGVFVAFDHVTRDEWQKYVANLNVSKYWPGIQGIGFSKPILAKDKHQHIQEIREEGYPEYTIKPDGLREEYSAVIYLEPFDWRNQRAFGYDMWSNESRREAMMRARDTGEAATSAIITLVQETDKDVQAGFLTYLPVYKTNGLPLRTVEERRKAFKGWVYSPFRAKDLMEGILGKEQDISFEIYDGENISKETLLFDTNSTTHFEKNASKAKHSKLVRIDLQGRTWTIYFESMKYYGNLFERQQPVIMAVGGALINALLFYALYSLSTLRKRANKLAKEMNRELVITKESLELKVKARTKDLEEARADLEQQVDERTKQLENRMKDLERTNRLMIGRENRMLELKEKINELREILRQKNDGG